MSAPIVIITVPNKKPNAASIVDSHSSSVAAVYDENHDVIAHGFPSYEAAYCWLHGATHDFVQKPETTEE